MALAKSAPKRPWTLFEQQKAKEEEQQKANNDEQQKAKEEEQQMAKEGEQQKAKEEEQQNANQLQIPDDRQQKPDDANNPDDLLKSNKSQHTGTWTSNYRRWGPYVREAACGPGWRRAWPSPEEHRRYHEQRRSSPKRYRRDQEATRSPRIRSSPNRYRRDQEATPSARRRSSPTRHQ